MEDLFTFSIRTSDFEIPDVSGPLYPYRRIYSIFCTGRCGALGSMFALSAVVCTRTLVCAAVSFIIHSPLSLAPRQGAARHVLLSRKATLLFFNEVYE